MLPLVRRALIVVVSMVFTLTGASAASANFVATAPDAGGDASDPSPGRDITGVGLGYDRRTGELVGAIQLAGEPTDDTRAFATVFAGTRTPSGCTGYPAVGFGSYTDEFGATWLRLDDAAGNGPRGDADKRGFSAAVQRFEITDRALAGGRPDCVMATLSEPGNPAVVYDTAGPIPLRGQPVMSLRIGGVPEFVPVGESRKVNLRLANTGDAPTGRIRLTFGRARGLSVETASRTVKSIAPGRRATVKATVTLGERAQFSTDLKVKATAGRLTLRDEATLYVRRPPSPGGGGGGGNGDGGTQSCVRYMADMSGETGGSLILVPC